MNIHEFLTDKGFDNIPKYRDALGGYITEYFRSEDRIAIAEDVDKMQVLTYYKGKFRHTSTDTYEEAFQFLQEVVV